MAAEKENPPPTYKLTLEQPCISSSPKPAVVDRGPPYDINNPNPRWKLWDSDIQDSDTWRIPVGLEPQQMICPHCNEDVLTVISYRPGLMTRLVCCLLCACVCWLFCFIPFCLKSCKDVVHTCPNCKKFISVFKRI